MKKGLSQKLLIGKVDPKNPGVMICEKETTSEIEESEIPADPVAIVDQDQGTNNWKPRQCYYNLIRAGFLTEETNKNIVTQDHITDDVIKRVKAAWNLDKTGDETESNEVAWWLRKCCAKTVKLY